MSLLTRLVRSARPRTTKTPTTIVSINPDWKDDFGHFGAWDKRVERHSLQRGHEFVSLCHRDLRQPPGFAIPTFSERLTPVQSPESVALFQSELRDALASSVAEPPVVACMYAGSLFSLAAVHQVAVDMPHIRFVVNLMRSHPLLDRSEQEASPERDRAIHSLLTAAERAGVRVAVDSAELQRRVRANFALDSAVWPMMATTPTGVLRASKTSSTIDIVAPIQPQFAKGFDLVAELANRLRPDVEGGHLTLTARHTPGVSDAIDRIAAEITTCGGRLVEGNVSVSDYGELIASADLIVVPYRSSVFATRTTAVVVDALAAGVPVVTTAGTWGSRVLGEFGVGNVFRDGAPDSLYEAVTAAVANLDEEAARVRSVRDDVIERFSPEPVLRFLTGDLHRSRVATDDGVADADVAEWVDRLRPSSR